MLARIKSRLTNSDYVAKVIDKVERLQSVKQNAFNVEHAGLRYEGKNMLNTIALVPAVNAQFDGQVAGMTTDVTIDADEAGLVGNVTLEADSILDIDALILAWNTANPTNTLTLSVGDGAQVPTADITLAGGLDEVPSYKVNSVDFSNATKISFSIGANDYEFLLADIKIIKRIRSRKYMFEVSTLTEV